MHSNHTLQVPIGLLLLPLLLTLFAACATGAGDFYEGPDVSAAQILRARGYLAEEFFFTTSAGYKLRITRGRNPVISGGYIKGRDPILFVHGVFATGNNFLVNSFGASPKDFTSIDLKNTSTSRLIELLKDEPSARALPLLALNCGFEIWIIDRRGAPGSRELSGDPLSLPASSERQAFDGTNGGLSEMALRASPLAQNRADSDSGGSWWDPLISFVSTTTNYGGFIQQVPFNFDKRFWNYSFDEQVLDDFPRSIEFVIEKTGSKRVSLVTHSSGGAIALMSQSLLPERLAPKISSQVHWAPAFSVGNDNPTVVVIFGALLPVLESYMGPAPPAIVTPVVQSSLSLLCANPLAQPTICRAVLTGLYGDGGGREPARPQLISSLLYASSSHEIAQLAQELRYDVRTMRHYNYGAATNLRVYGSAMPPRYELARLQTPPNTMSIYSGSTDGLVTVADVNLTVSQIQVPHKYKVISEIPYSHVGYFFNEEAPMRAIIPSMQELATMTPQ